MENPAISRNDALDALYRRPGFLLRRAHQISVSLFLNESAETGITTTQYGVMLILRHCEGLDQIGLSKKVGLDRTTTALVVTKLAKKGMLVRVDDDKDKRRKVIILTARGERMLEMLRKPAESVQYKALSIFEPDEVSEFLRLLQKVVTHFNDRTRTPISNSEGGGTV